MSLAPCFLAPRVEPPSSWCDNKSLAPKACDLASPVTKHLHSFQAVAQPVVDGFR